VSNRTAGRGTTESNQDTGTEESVGAGTRGGGRRPPGNARRQAKQARVAAARAAAARARRRRQMLIALASGVAVVVVIVGLVLLLGGNKPKHRTASTANASAGASAAPSSAVAGPQQASPAAPFPPLPQGAAPALKTKPVVKAGTGTLTSLKVTTLVAGKGAAAAKGQTITVNYVGVSYQTGKEFDSSWSRSQPFSFAIGNGEVIKGWDDGLVGVKVGSRVQLDIPADLAYGNTGTNGSPSGPLRFVVDVLDAK
jgi:peptidylprolyl isomerase